MDRVGVNVGVEVKYYGSAGVDWGCRYERE